MPTRQKKNPPRIPPIPSCGAETKITPNFKNLFSLGFANPSPAKLFRKTESVFAFLHLASFSQIISGEVQSVSLKRDRSPVQIWSSAPKLKNPREGIF